MLLNNQCTLQSSLHRVSIGRMPDRMQLRSVPAIAVFPDRAGEEIAIVGRRAPHHVGVEAPALSAMHSGIDPQRHPNIGAHALTLDAPTDT
jgi:hypothetical protein